MINKQAIFFTRVVLLMVFAVRFCVPVFASDFTKAIVMSRNLVREFQAAAGAPAISVAVGAQGKIVWAEAFGYADLERRARATTETRFRIGSVSKVLTAASVAKLYQEQKLDLDAPIQQYVPSFPDKGSRITARLLAGHLAGIRHYADKDWQPNIDHSHYESIEDSLRIFKDDPLVASSGSSYHYSTFGYTLLSQVVEAAARQKFLIYMEEEIFKPIGMKSTCADAVGSIILNRSAFYERGKDGRIENAPYVDSSYKWAGGGFLSTASDLVKFGFVHTRAGFFRQDTLDVLLQSQRTSKGEETNVGMGWRIAKDSEGRRVYHHAGSINGGRAVLIVFPDSQLVVSFLSNLGQAPQAVEQTALILAQSFLAALEGQTRPNPKITESKRLRYSLDESQPAREGTLELNGSTGYISIPPPLLAFLQRTRSPYTPKLKLIATYGRTDAANYVVVSAAGLLPLKVQKLGDRLSAEIPLPLGPKMLEIKMRLADVEKDKVISQVIR